MGTIRKINGACRDNIMAVNGIAKASTSNREGFFLLSPLWVGVGRDGRVMYSPDAINWVEYESPPGESSDYWDVSFGKDSSNNQRWIVATNTSPEIRYSADPAVSNSWSSIDFSGTNDVTRVVEYGANGTWIAATGDDVFRSTDGGDTWTKITDVVSGAGLNICLATDGIGNWVMGGGVKVLKSTDDGLNWYVTLQSVGQTNGVEYNNGIWFRAGNGSTSHRIASLTDNNSVDNWSSVTGLSNSALWAICHIDGDTWMTANKGNTLYISTDNCASWTNAGLASPSSGQIMGLASDGTTVVSVGKDNKVNTSTDNGQSWTTRFTSAVDLLVVEYNKVKPFNKC